MAAVIGFVRNDSFLAVVFFLLLLLLLLLLSLTVAACALRRSSAAADGRSTDFDRHIEFEIDKNHLANDKLKLMQFLDRFLKDRVRMLKSYEIAFNRCFSVILGPFLFCSVSL